MPNHWQFAVFPERDGEVTRFFRWLTHTHAMRAITHRRVMGMGREPAGACAAKAAKFCQNFCGP
ncbi:MAG TPA: hypothetical protein VFE47_22915 [Tepidisphaeraceae bacterium]|jgi:hypothetical protein|nr:hypothetical protein [Tepidisphaeraceae bacterium]